MILKAHARIDALNLSESAKYKLFILLLGAPAGIAGLLIWVLIKPLYFSSPDWLFCFIVYPVIATFFTVVIYSCNHSFHEGAYTKPN